MEQTVNHPVGVLVDAAIVDTVCTACRMRLHRLRWLLEEAETAHHEAHLELVVLGAGKALKRLKAQVHVCAEAM